MKLPDFLQFAPLNALRQAMGAPLGSFTPSKSLSRLTPEEIEALARCGIATSLDGVRELADGTLAYKDSRVMLHVREPELPAFHVSGCQKVAEMRGDRQGGRCVVSTREDGLFELAAPDIGGYGSRLERLDVCQACLGKLCWQGFHHSLSKAERHASVESFKPKAFFAAYGKLLSMRDT